MRTSIIACPIIIVLAILCCKERPTNPLDQQNANSNGDPFALSAQFTSRGVEVQWAPLDNSGIEQYVIYRSEDSASEPMAIDSVKSGRTSYLDSDLASNATYYYRISAMDKNGRESVLSHPSRLTVPGLNKWTKLGSGNGIYSSDGNWFVTSMCTYNGELIVGGDFNSIDDAPGTYKVAAWNGENWHGLAQGVGGPTPFVSALTVYDGKLYAGLYLGEVITVWDGSGSWSLLSGASQPHGYVADFTEYKGHLVVSGRFTQEDSLLPPEPFYLGDGNQWNWPSYLWGGPGPVGYAGSLAVYGDWLVLGDEGGQISVYTDQYVEDIPSLVSNGRLGSMIVYNDRLIVGGSFTSIGGVPANNIAAWDGSSWTALGTGTNGVTGPFTIYHNKLVVAGGFTQAGGGDANGIACWDGISWSRLGTELNPGVNPGATVLTVYNDQLIAGGYITTVSGVVVNGIAAWQELAP